MRQLWSAEAEQSVLGALLLESEVFDDLVDLGLSAESFFDQRHRLAWQAIADLLDGNQPVDVVTVSELLECRNELERAGGPVYLSRMVDMVPTVENALAYGSVVREREVERVYMVAAQQITAALQDDGFEDHAARVAHIQQILTATERDERALTMQTLGASLKNMLQLIDDAANNKGITGVQTGFQHVDYRLGGMQPGDLGIIGGRPGMGKTAYMTNIVRNVAVGQNQRVLVFSLEMPNVQLAQRMTAAAGKVNLGLIKSGKVCEIAGQPEKLSAGVSILRSVADRVLLDEEPSLPINELVARAKRAHRNEPLGLVVVDHIGLVESTLKTDNEPLRVGQVSRALKKLAKQLGCPVIGLCQVNRDCEKRANKRPMLSDLRMSGAIEQDADWIQFVYRDEYYNENTQYPGIIEIISAKVRNGERGVDYLGWNGPYQRLDTIEKPAEQQGNQPTRDDIV